MFRPHKSLVIHDLEEMGNEDFATMVVRSSLQDHSEVEPWVFSGGGFAWTRTIPSGEEVTREFLRGVAHVSFLWYTRLKEPTSVFKVRFKAHDIDVRLWESQSVEAKAIEGFLRTLISKEKQSAIPATTRSPPITVSA